RACAGVALIGAGVGVAPLRALAAGLTYAPGEVVLLHRFTDRPLFAHELGQLAEQRGLRVVDLPGHRRSRDSWLGAGVQADDVTALRTWVPDVAERDVYVCGPERWTEAVRLAATAAGVRADRLHIEKFAW
ncbi:MAG: oxidoreductase, partial [Umezawaea sp.]